MTDFLTELKDLFSEKNISSIVDDFEKSSFFTEHYLTQTFRESDSRFKKKSYYLQDGYPIQLNQELAKKLKNGEEIKVIKSNGYNSYINKWKGRTNLQYPVDNNNDVYNTPLRVSKTELKKTRELKMFRNGSNQNPEQFETWSAEKMYKQWLLLRLSKIEKPNWPIMDYVFFLFINQISCMLNSYVIYGTHTSDGNIDLNEQQKYNEYLQKLDEFIKNGGLYKDLLDVHLLFCEWYDIRILFAITHKKKRLIKISKHDNRDINGLFKKNNEMCITFRKIINESSLGSIRDTYTFIRNTFNKTLNLRNFILFIFTSYFQNIKKSNQLYSFPVIPILGIPYKTHDGNIYTPKVQFMHDYTHVENSLIPYFHNLYTDTNNSNERIDDIKVFFEKMLFLMKLNESSIGEKKIDNAHYFLWWYLHENSFLYMYKLQQTDNNRYNMYSFFDILLFKSDLEKLIELLLKKNNKLKTKTNFYNSENYSELLESIQLLVKICDETLEDERKNIFLKKIQNETKKILGNNSVGINNE
jgi:hypothetical protein